MLLAFHHVVFSINNITSYASRAVFLIDFFTYPKVRPNKDGLLHAPTTRFAWKT